MLPITVILVCVSFSCNTYFDAVFPFWPVYNDISDTVFIEKFGRKIVQLLIMHLSPTPIRSLLQDVEENLQIPKQVKKSWPYA